MLKHLKFLKNSKNNGDPSKKVQRGLETQKNVFGEVKKKAIILNTWCT